MIYSILVGTIYLVPDFFGIKKNINKRVIEERRLRGSLWQGISLMEDRTTTFRTKEDLHHHVKIHVCAQV